MNNVNNDVFRSLQPDDMVTHTITRKFEIEPTKYNLWTNPTTKDQNLTNIQNLAWHPWLQTELSLWQIFTATEKLFFFIKEKLNPDLLKTQTNSECMYSLQIDFFLDIQMNQKQ